MPEPTVLIVDDNLMNLKLFAFLLRAEGYAVETATTARDALLSLARSRPALILMDVQLPDADGLTLTRSLKNDEATRTTRIVAITAFASNEVRERALAAGCDGFIAKPIDTRLFTQTIADYLKTGTE